LERITKYINKYMPKPSKKKKFSFKKALVAIGAIGIIAGSATVTKRVIDPGEIVTEVIDGDTFRIENGQSIRLFGIDAPELQYCFGEEAKDALSSKVFGKKVILKGLKTDIYKRIQAFVYVDGEFVNEYMSKNGFAYYDGNKTETSEIIKETSYYARDNKLGIFSEECSPTVPIKKNCGIKGQISHDLNKYIYMLPGCRDYDQTKVERYRGEDWFCTENEAKAAGFVKSSNCQ